jgi:hypothetical protein
MDGGDAVCNGALLWSDLAVAGGFLWCRQASTDVDPAELSPRRGTVVIDGDGHVVDIPGFDSARKQVWFEQFANQSWPCLASQTLGLECSNHG